MAKQRKSPKANPKPKEKKETHTASLPTYESNSRTPTFTRPKPSVNLNQPKKLYQKKKMNTVSLSIWPPTQRTRDAVITRLIQTLSTPTLLSKRYGALPLDEASATARSIEEEAFSFASSATDSTTAGVKDEGFNTLQLYSKEISKKMLEAVKCRDSSAVDTSE